MSRLFQITEEDLVGLEKIFPSLCMDMYTQMNNVL